MKNRLFFIVGLLAVLSLSAQHKYMVVKMNGDTLHCDQVSAGGKTIICKTDGQDKIKLNASDVRFYVRPWRTFMQKEGVTKAYEVDSTKKCIVPKDGNIYIVQIENDSVYLVESTQINTETGAMDYYIFRKNNNEAVMEIRKDKSSIETLKKYFGGSCTTFDAKLVEVKPKFQKAVFPYDEWYNLLYFYNQNCKK